MAIDILSIPQIASPDLANFQNDLHMGFGGDIRKRATNARWTDESRSKKAFPDTVDALLAEFILAQQNEDTVYMLTQGSELTKRRLEKDKQRDTIYKEVRKTVDTFATLTIFPEKQAAALIVQPVMHKYKIDPDGGIEAQTVATEQWLQEHLRNYQLELASKELGISESIQQLKTLNEEIQKLTADRNDERSTKVTAELKTARTATDQAFRAMALMLNAMAITAEQNKPYVDLIVQINETIKYYRQISDERRRSNRRVAVKSEIVGNHTYATVAGWTWQRLVDEGKAALEVTTPDGTTEPRILSTEKKALKAGGLMLALDGAAVKPTDEVDAAREYELVAIE